MTSWIPGTLEQVGPALLALGFAIAFAESAVGLGIVLPGEALIAALGAIAVGPTETLVVVVVVTAGAVCGDQSGFTLGRRFGRTWRSSRLLRRIGVDNWDRADDLVSRRGLPAVVLTRWLPVVRTLVPVVAGALRMPRPRFTFASLLGSLTWWIGTGAVLANLIDGSTRIQLLAILALLLLGTLALRREMRSHPHAWR